MDMDCKKTCRFCLKIIHENKFDVVEDIIRHMLDTLHLKLDLERGQEYVMCPECLMKLKNAVDFKTICLGTENKMPHLINSEVKQSLKENSLENRQNVCRFCTTNMKSGCWTYLQEWNGTILEVDILKKYIPELHLCDTEKVEICKSCYESLQDFFTFITNCLDVDEKIKNNAFVNINKLKLKDSRNVDMDLAKLEETNEIVPEKVEILDVEASNMELAIKHEKIDIKIEQSISESIQDTSNEKIDFINHHVILSDIYKCEDSSLHKKHNFNLTEHNSTLQNNFETVHYKCDNCSYKTTFKSNLKNHMLTHNALSDLFKCEYCSFETRHKCSLKRHYLTHNEILDIIFYKCEICSFETKHKANIKRHCISHQQFPTVKMYKCGKCTYKSNCKDNLRKHMSSHRAFFDGRVFKCEKCVYVTKYKCNLKKHAQIHKGLSAYKYSFNTKHKINCKIRRLVYQNHPGIATYKCEKCSYVTRYRANLNRHHMSRHNSRMLFELQKCKICSFETRFQSHLRKHVLNHHGPQELPEYKCEICPFKTKSKSNLKKHLRLHQDSSEVEIFRCDKCSFESRHKICLQRHSLTHQDLSEATLYKCLICSFQAKRKDSLKRHIQIHNPKTALV